MARKIKFHSLHILFRLFAFLADKTGGWRLFVKPKMILGSLLLGIGLTGCGTKTENKTEENKSKESKITIHKLQSESNSSYRKEAKSYKPDSTKFKKTSSRKHEKKKNNIKQTAIDTTLIYEHVEQMPQFPGGEDSLTAHIKKINTLPFSVSDKDTIKTITGDVICMFVVTKNGDIEQIKTISKANYYLDREAINIIKNLPRFIPGRHNGKNVNVLKTMTVPVVIFYKTSTSTSCYMQIMEVEAKLDTTTKNSIEPIYWLVQQMPQFPGTPYKLSCLIDEHLKYPREAKEKGIQGAVICRFLVTKTGKIKKVHVIESLDRDCDREAIRVVKRLSRFIPGQHKGEKVNVWHTLPIEFKLPENK